MPEYSFFHIPRPAVMQEPCMTVHCVYETDTPKRWCSPFIAVGFEIRTAVCQCCAHVMQQQVGIREYFLVREIGETRMVACYISGLVARNASCLVEEFFALQHCFVVVVPAGRHSEVADVQQYFLKVVVCYFRLPAVRSSATTGLYSCTVLRRKQ